MSPTFRKYTSKEKREGRKSNPINDFFFIFVWARRSRKGKKKVKYNMTSAEVKKPINKPRPIGNSLAVFNPKNIRTTDNWVHIWWSNSP